MIREIPFNGMAADVGRFSDPQAEMVLASIIEENTRAQLWVAAEPEDGLALLWDKGNNVFYLSGEQVPKEVVNEFSHLVGAEIAERAIAEGLAHFRVRALSEACQRAMVRLFPGINLRRTRQRFYAFRKPQVPAVPVSALREVQFVPIDADLLQRQHLQNLQYVRAEIEWMWPSLARFYERGFGLVALSGETIACSCTAEYASGTKCGIGIGTFPGFRSKGLATATAARFVERCLGRDIIPHWECNAENVASVRVAEKVGFEKIQEATSWSGAFDWMETKRAAV